MKAQEFGWEGEETACASAGLHSVPAHTAALQGAGSLAPTNTEIRGELVPAWIQVQTQENMDENNA